MDADHGGRDSKRACVGAARVAAMVGAGRAGQGRESSPLGAGSTELGHGRLRVANLEAGTDVL